MSSIDFLEDERRKIWARLSELEASILTKLPEDKQQALQILKKCSEYKNRCENAHKRGDELVAEILRISELAHTSNIEQKISQIRALHSEIVPKSEDIFGKIERLEELFGDNEEYAKEIEQLESVVESARDYSAKTEAVAKQIAQRKNEIDEFYYELFGFVETDQATGEKTEVKGRKEELENSYSELQRGFSVFSHDKGKEFSDAIATWEKEYVALKNRISSLLPHALTTGLSHAYSEKKDAEKAETIKLNRVFQNYIFGLIGVSLIPFGVSVWLLLSGASLEATLLKMPRLVLSILPLYIPVLWVAYSANKKINLSKRLIEEYTHKEVLSKTFEGLSTQIQEIDDSNVAGELRTKLLYNILEVSSENPGKLISDYNNSDHPLMDALDKSVRLGNAVDNLAKIPGMSKLMSVLDSKAKETLKRTEEKAEIGLERVGARPVE